jgi:hypothetical protein
LVVNTNELGIAQHDTRIAANNGETFFEESGITIIVVTLPSEIFTSGQFHNTIMVPGSTAVPVTSIVTNPRILGRVLPANLLSSIR